MKKSVSILAGLALAGIANAAVVDLGGGWEASWDASLDPFVEVFGLGVVPTPGIPGSETLVIQKSAEFTQAPPFPGFPFPTIPIAFRQIDPNAADYIAIDDEIITNSTGIDWLDFHMVLLDSGEVSFDPALTLASGGAGPSGFSIAPFTNSSFSPDNQEFNVDGGVIPDGSQWFPGSGIADGLLFIDPVKGDGTAQNPLRTFVLKETPTVPSPGTIALIGVGGLAMGGRRRR